MAQAIHCDFDGHADALADVMVSALANGDTTAWCFAHYVDVCRAVVRDAEAAIAEAVATDQDAADRLAEAGPAPFRPGGDPEGDEPVEAGLGGPEADQAGQAGQSPADEQPGPGGPELRPVEAETTAAAVE